MRASDFTNEGRKKKKRKVKYGAAWGPGPYGLYGYDAGYSGEGGMSDGGGGESIINEAWTPDKKQRIKDFALWAIKLLEIEQAPKIKLVGDTKTTALGYFDPNTQDIVVSVKDRHQMDIMRTLAHELVHRKQNEARELNGETGSDDENEANALAGVLLRYWGKMNPEQFNEAWSDKYKRSINCNNPKGFSQRAHCQGRKKEEDLAQETNKLIPYPKGTVKIDVDDVYDWYKLGMNISDLDDADPEDFGKGPPQTVINFGSEPVEHKYLKALQRLKLKTHDVDENFADGKNPQDKGDSARHGITKGMSIAQLKKIRSSDTASPRKKQLAHWQINMRQGKKK